MQHNQILMAEDDPGLAIPLKEFFEDNGLEVIHTGNGEEIMPLYEIHTPDLILLDIVLPGKNGFEAIKDIRNKNLSVPIILMTGSELDSGSEIKGYELGAINYIRKPVLPQALLALIKNLLSLPKDLKKYKMGDYTITIHNTYLEINNDRIKLRDKDMLVFRKLIEKRGRLVKREELMIEAWGKDEYSYNNRLNASICRLKKELAPWDHIRIRPLQGHGYLLEEK